MVRTGDLQDQGYITKAQQPRFYAYLSVTQTLPEDSQQVAELDTTNLDVGNYFNTGTYRYQPLIAGDYIFFASWRTAAALNLEMSLNIRKNGSTNRGVINANLGTTYTKYMTQAHSTIFSMNGSTDYVEMLVSKNDYAGSGAANAAAISTYLMGYLIG